MDNEELPRVFQRDGKMGDEMIVLGAHVRISKIELVIETKILDGSNPKRSKITVRIPMKDFENPFPYHKE